MSAVLRFVLFMMFIPLMMFMIVLAGHYESFINVTEDQKMYGAIQNGTVNVLIMFDEIPPDEIFYVIPVIDGINEWEEKLNVMYPDGEWNIDMDLWSGELDQNLGGYDIYTNVVLGYDIACEESYKGITSYDPFIFGKGFITNEVIITEPCDIEHYKSWEEVRAISAHEFGHSLGLGHSYVDNDLMCNYENCFLVSKDPHVSRLNLMAVWMMYGEDGFPLPNPIDFNKTKINNP